VLGLVGTLTARHVNWWIAGSKATHGLIAISYLLPHHRFR